MAARKRGPSRRRKAETVRGQANPKDSATSVFWSAKESFSELFNKVVFKREVVHPDSLRDAGDVQSAWVRVSRNAGFFLKNTRDVCKESEEAGLLVILGLENMATVDYQMAFRVMLLDVLNYGRQINLIEAEHRAEEETLPEEERPKLEGGEYVGGFRKDDKLKRAITLVIYYGKEPWDGPTRLFDMMENPTVVDWDEGYPNGDYPMYLLDVRRMSEEMLNGFSPHLKAFFGFLKYEAVSSEKLEEFVFANDEVFRNASPVTMDALIELTGVKELRKYMEEFKTQEGGTDMCEGIKFYGMKMAKEAGHRNFVEAAQMFQHSLEETERAFAVKFHVEPDEAEREVRKYWKEEGQVVCSA